MQYLISVISDDVERGGKRRRARGSMAASRLADAISAARGAGYILEEVGRRHGYVLLVGTPGAESVFSDCDLAVAKIEDGTPCTFTEHGIIIGDSECTEG